jgi:RNA polymerase sigma-70 factor (ECF subfamily)
MANEPALMAANRGVRRVAEADATETDAVFRAHLEASLAGGYRLASVILGNPADAEDVTQDAVERAWRSRGSLREIDRFEAWFQRIVVNACRDRVRRRRAMPVFVEVRSTDADVAHSGTRANDPYADTAERDAVRAALARINVDQRAVVAMRFYLDLEIDEIARRLGTRPGTVKSRLHRGLKVLRAAWEIER